MSEKTIRGTYDHLFIVVCGFKYLESKPSIVDISATLLWMRSATSSSLSVRAGFLFFWTNECI